MKLTVNPPLSQWSVPSSVARRGELAALVHANADRLGTGRLDGDRPIIATGHQAFFWHPGILAKDIAARAAAGRLDADALHVVVDQDVHDATTLDVPHVRDERVVVDRARLAAQDLAVPTGMHEPVTFAPEHPHLPAALVEAMGDLPACESLAQQITVALSRLRRAVAGDMPVVFASQLARLPVFGELIARMLADPRRCVAAYNNAARQVPEAGITSLQLSRDLVELPLWQLLWSRPRRRVFADVADARALLVADDGSPIDDTSSLAPRALTLTAVMRSSLCDGFVHGLGGGAYDRIMEAWWTAWIGRPLAPMAVVTADLFMTFDAPVADRAELHRAVWFAHHLPHNLDRVLRLEGSLATHKRALIDAMIIDRDRPRRAAAFAEVHRINRELAAAHPDALADARRRLDRTRLGLANWRATLRRDWCFALYPPDELHALADAIRQAATIAA